MSKLSGINERNAEEYEKEFAKQYGFDISNRQSFLGLPDDKKRKVTDTLGITQPNNVMEVEAVVLPDNQ